MPTQTRQPTGDADISGTWDTAPTAGQPRWQQVDEDPFDDTDYAIGQTDAGGFQLFSFTAFSIGPDNTISDLTVDYRSGKAGAPAANLSARIKVGGNYYDADSHNPTQAFAARTATWTTNPDTGVAWTVNQINGVGANALQQMGLNSTDSAPDVRCSFYKATVNFVEVADALFMRLGISQPPHTRPVARPGFVFSLLEEAAIPALPATPMLLFPPHFAARAAATAYMLFRPSTFLDDPTSTEPLPAGAVAGMA